MPNTQSLEQAERNLYGVTVEQMLHSVHVTNLANPTETIAYAHGQLTGLKCMTPYFVAKGDAEALQQSMSRVQYFLQLAIDTLLEEKAK